MFTAALLVTDKIWKQPRLPSINECVDTEDVIYYSAIEMNKILPPVTTWMNLKDIMMK